MLSYVEFQAFVEMEELTSNGEQREWKETARWIKFEENVEDSNRWGKPHVASLTFHSLVELKKGLERGTCMSIPKYPEPSSSFILSSCYNFQIFLFFFSLFFSHSTAAKIACCSLLLYFLKLIKN